MEADRIIANYRAETDAMKADRIIAGNNSAYVTEAI